MNVKGRRGRKWLWIGGLAVLAVALSLALKPKGTPEEDKDKVKTAKAEVGDVQVRVTEVGSVEPQVKVDVKSALSGKVVELLVREGDRVKRGQVLARVEPDVNQARDLAQVKNAVREAEITLSEAKANLRAQPRPARAGPALASRTTWRARPATGPPRPPTTPRSRSTGSSRRAACPSAWPGRHTPAPERHLAHGRRRDPPQRRAGRHRHLGRLVLQRGHRADDRGRRRDHDHQGRRQRGGHRQGAPRAAGQGLARRLSQGASSPAHDQAHRARPPASRRRSRSSTWRSRSTARAPSCARA